MKVQFSLVGHIGQRQDQVVDLPQIPREGDVINLPGISQANTYVRTVVWYISHDDDDEPLDEPFVYVVVGPPRGNPIRSSLQNYLEGPEKEGE